MNTTKTEDPRVTLARAAISPPYPRLDVLLPASALTSMWWEMHGHVKALLAVIDAQQPPQRETVNRPLCWHRSAGGSDCLMDAGHFPGSLHSDTVLLWDGDGRLCNLSGEPIDRQTGRADGRGGQVRSDSHGPAGQPDRPEGFPLAWLGDSALCPLDGRIMGTGSQAQWWDCPRGHVWELHDGELYPGH
jgi:hypothetical protein